jgi:hypothetical protein
MWGDAQHGEHHDHEAYVGDRTTEAIVSFAEKLVPAPAGSAALPAADLAEHALQTVRVRATSMCSFAPHHRPREGRDEKSADLQTLRR